MSPDYRLYKKTIDLEKGEKISLFDAAIPLSVTQKSPKSVYLWYLQELENDEPTTNDDGEDEVDRMLEQLKREAEEMENAEGLHAHKKGIEYAVEMVERVKYDV